MRVIRARWGGGGAEGHDEVYFRKHEGDGGHVISCTHIYRDCGYWRSLDVNDREIPWDGMEFSHNIEIPIYPWS